jgi:hypothetical protein
MSSELPLFIILFEAKFDSKVLIFQSGFNRFLSMFSELLFLLLLFPEAKFNGENFAFVLNKLLLACLQLFAINV